MGDGRRATGDGRRAAGGGRRAAIRSSLITQTVSCWCPSRHPRVRGARRRLGPHLALLGRHAKPGFRGFQGREVEGLEHRPDRQRRPRDEVHGRLAHLRESELSATISAHSAELGGCERRAAGADVPSGPGGSTPHRPIRASQARRAPPEGRRRARSAMIAPITRSEGPRLPPADSHVARAARSRRD